MRRGRWRAAARLRHPRASAARPEDRARHPRSTPSPCGEGWGGKTPPTESAANTPPDPSGHPPHKGEGKTLFTKPDLDDMGHDVATPSRPLFRKNTLDEMTVGRTEKPLNTKGKLPEKPVLPGPSSPQRGEDGSPQEAKRTANLARGADDPKPLLRAKPGVGSYEDAGDAKRARKRPREKPDDRATDTLRQNAPHPPYRAPSPRRNGEKEPAAPSVIPSPRVRGEG